MTPRLLIALVLAAAVAGPAAEPHARADDPEFVVIVHPDNRAQSLDRKFVADAFLKKVSRWGDDRSIQPVDQKPSREVRRDFSRSVLGRSLAAVLSYWRQLVFSGRGVPPPQVENDEAVVRYVRSNRGAIGYVTGKASLDGVRAIRVR